MKRSRISSFLSLVIVFVMVLGLMPESAFAEAGIEINETNFPDENFRSLVQLYDWDEDGYFSSEEIASITGMGGDNRSIQSLKGIEFFTELEELYISTNQISTLDLSKNTKLKQLQCSFNQLKSLDLSNNTSLQSLGCSHNQLETLDLTHNTKLNSLYCPYNPLTALDLSQNTDLVSLDCSWSQLTALDLSRNSKIETVNCEYNNITSLHLGNISSLKELICSGSQLGSLDVSKNTLLEVLECRSCQLESLVLGDIKSLKEIDCYSNELTSLDISNNTALERLYCSGNLLEELDVSNARNLKVLSFESNNIKSIDVSGNTKLEDLCCSYNQLTSLNVSNNPKLTRLWFSNNKVTSIDLSKNTELKRISCSSNTLSSLDLTNQTKITELDCQNCKLESIDISHLTDLDGILCTYNKFTTLDISKNSKLRYLYCYGNNIASLDLRNTPNLLAAVTEGTITEYSKDIQYRKDNYTLHVDKTTKLITDDSQIPIVPDIAVYHPVFSFKSEIMVKGKEEGDLWYTADYSDNWFYMAPSTYNHYLAIMSLGMTMASISDSSKTNTYNIAKLYNDLDFKEVNSQYPTPKDNSIGYTIGFKNVKNQDGNIITLIAVTVRSGGYGEEWAGNFEVGKDTDHSGFDKGAKLILLGGDYLNNKYGDDAKTKLITGITDYIEAHKDLFAGKLKFWISGYSRGAAVANLLAAKLDKGELNSFLGSKGLASVTKNDVYAYCFECPQNTTASDANSTKYNNIHSVINPLDLVTKVAPSKWGFKRYGTVHTIYSSTNTAKYHFGIKSKMVDKYKAILDYRNYRFTYSTKQIADNLTMETLGQPSVLDAFWGAIAKEIGNKRIFTDAYQNTVKGIVRKYLGGADKLTIEPSNPQFDSTWDMLKEIVEFVYGKQFSVLNMGVAVATGLELFVSGGSTLAGKNNGVPLRAHYPELCLAWMLAIRDNPDLYFASGSSPERQGISSPLSDEEPELQEVVFAPNTTRILYISGDTDVSVYNPEGSLVGKIENNEAAEIENGIYCYISDDYQKVFILPNDLEYRIEMNPRSDGKLTYTCVETDYVDNEEERLVSYQELDIHKGVLLSGVIEDIREESSVGEYKLYLGDQEQAPTIVQTDDEIVQYEVSVNTEGFGTVSGGGLYHGGDYAVLKVITQESHFRGWFVDNTCVSNDLEYQFTVRGDTTVTAVFDALTTERITEVQVDGISPTVGMSAGRQIRSLSIPSDKQYNVNIEAFTQWYCETDSIYMDESDIFESGKEYSLRILISANDGYAFAENKNVSWQINGGTDLVDPEVSYIAGNKQEAVLRTVPISAVSNLPFTDTKPGKFYFDPVAWAYYHEPQITTGTDDTHFSPNNTCTRAQVVTFLWRANGCPEPETTKNPFTDVKSTAYYYKAVLWAVENNITTGLKDAAGNPTGKFDPKGDCTRGQVVTFLYRASGSPSFETTECPFTDVKPKAFYYNATLWAVENDITTGMKDKDGNLTGLFAPNDSCTRGQVVTFLYRSR